MMIFLREACYFLKRIGIIKLNFLVIFYKYNIFTKC